MPRLTLSTCLRLMILLALLQLFIDCLPKFYGPKSYEDQDVNFDEDIPHVSESVVPNALFQANLTATSGSWQTVDGNEADKFVVYAAFLDVRKTKMIRAIAVAATSRRKRPKVWCKYWYRDGGNRYENKTVEGKLQIIKEHWDLKYSPFYVLCPVGFNDSIADLVSVLSAPEQTPNNLLKIMANYDTPNKWDPAGLPLTVTKIALCVKPFHYNYNKIMELLEFIELHRIMGVDHFFLYNHTTGPQVGCLLQRYQKEGIVTVLEWQLPVVSQKEIRTEGLFASINDCLYRTMHKYSHTVFVDFDEFIMPTRNYSYRQLLEFLDQDAKHWAAFLFRNSFFYKEWADDPEIQQSNDAIAKNLMVLRKTTRRKDFHYYRIRSKYIVRPELINMAGNHFVWDYHDKKRFKTLNVRPEDAFLHHYRSCEYAGDDCVKHQSTVDKTAYKYKNELITAVGARHKQVFTECKLSDATEH